MEDREIPDWNRETPALAGRLIARGVPTPIFYFAIAIAVLIGFAYRSVFAQFLGASLGMLASFIIGGIVAFGICWIARVPSKKDRDWFAISIEWFSFKIYLLKIRTWEWFYKW